MYDSEVLFLFFVLQTEEVRSVTANFNKTSLCRNFGVLSGQTAFTVTCWDNAAIYTSVHAGDRIQLNDVKVGKRDGQPILTARYADQIVVRHLSLECTLFLIDSSSTHCFSLTHLNTDRYIHFSNHMMCKCYIQCTLFPFFHFKQGT